MILKLKMRIEIKEFLELTTEQLYHILQLRSEVFVVEQDCVYQDLDGKDQKALHVIGYGVDIMKASITAIEKYFKDTNIHLSAQCYLIKFYNSLGFKEVGEEYLEDGIPHVGMIRRA